MSWFQNIREGWHVHLTFDEGLGWMVIYRGNHLDGGEALSSEVPRVRRLAKKVALWNPDHGLRKDGTTFIWPQRGSDKGG